jgi:hypothetical protein
MKRTQIIFLLALATALNSCSIGFDVFFRNFSAKPVDIIFLNIPERKVDAFSFSKNIESLDQRSVTLNDTLYAIQLESGAYRLNVPPGATVRLGYQSNSIRWPTADVLLVQDHVLIDTLWNKSMSIDHFKMVHYKKLTSAAYYDHR